VRALAVQVEIEIREQWGEAIRVVNLDVGSIPGRELQFVCFWIGGEFGFEEAFRSDFAHWIRRAFHHHRGVHGLGKKRSNYPAVGGGMGAEDPKRVAVVTADDGFEFVREHAQLLWQRHFMNKAELHLHLEGSIEAETLLAIDPSLSREEIEGNLTCASFEEFLRGYVWVTKLLQAPEHYALATRHLLERLAAQDVTYAEITLSAGVVLWKGQDLGAVYEAIWRETLRSSVKAEAGQRVAEFAVSRRGSGTVAFGIGGDEARGPAEWFRDVFAYARDSGLRLTCHAGETMGPESIWAALEIGAERIGHGIAAVRDEALMRALRERNIPLEICISSNVCMGLVPSVEEHPVRRLYDAGVPIVLNTDDPAFFRTTLTREYELAERVCGLPVEELRANGFRYAFG
jgi:aminodeoxyfutalosine deaminase